MKFVSERDRKSLCVWINLLWEVIGNVVNRRSKIGYLSPRCGAQRTDEWKKRIRPFVVIHPNVLNTPQDAKHGKRDNVVTALGMKTLDECGYSGKLITLSGTVQGQNMPRERPGMNV